MWAFCPQSIATAGLTVSLFEGYKPDPVLPFSVLEILENLVKKLGRDLVMLAISLYRKDFGEGDFGTERSRLMSTKCRPKDQTLPTFQSWVRLGCGPCRGSGVRDPI
jgi:hypothetical protein